MLTPVAGWPREMWFENEKLTGLSGKDLAIVLRKKKKEKEKNKVTENRAYNQRRLGRKNPYKLVTDGVSFIK